MRRIVMGFLATQIFLSITGGASAYALTEVAPYQPGDSLFPIQMYAGSARLAVTTDATSRAWLQLDLADRRIRNQENGSGRHE